MKLKIYLSEAWMCSEFGYQRPMSNKKGLRFQSHIQLIWKSEFCVVDINFKWNKNSRKTFSGLSLAYSTGSLSNYWKASEEILISSAANFWRANAHYKNNMVDKWPKAFYVNCLIVFFISIFGNAEEGPENCPLQGKCQIEGENVVYVCTVTRNDNGLQEKYCGSTQWFKSRWYQHNSNERHWKNRNKTSLAGYIWKLKENDSSCSLRSHLKGYWQGKDLQPHPGVCRYHYFKVVLNSDSGLTPPPSLVPNSLYPLFSVAIAT